MKKIIAVITIVVFSMLITSCGKVTPKDAVINFLDQYRNLSSEVLMDIEDVIKDENFTQAQQEKYRNIIKRQYQDLEYSINKEEYDDDIAHIYTTIKVYDLFKVQQDADNYLNNHYDEFRDDTGTYSSDLFMDYKLDQMVKVNDKVEYELIFNVLKNEIGEYKVTDITEEMLKKIHGIYDYTI